MGWRIFLLLSVIAMGIATPIAAQDTTLTPEQRIQGEALVQQAAEILAESAREPSSIIVRNVYLRKRIADDGREPISLCGEVNGRNGYGGFTGYQAFILLGDEVHVGRLAGFTVEHLCSNRNPIIDTRDYAPEMQAALAAIFGRQ